MAQHKKSRKHVIHHDPAKQRLSRWLWLGGIGVVIAIVGAFNIRNNAASSQIDPAVQVAGAPRIVVDQETIDQGDHQLGSTITTVFRIRNVGDQPLNILNNPQVQVVMGCCPPPVELSSKVIQPGQEATLSLTYMMHTGMGGKHRFNINLQTNDPTQPTKQLVVLSNWV